jgi:hypothetical protein
LDFCTRFLVAHGWYEAESKRLARISHSAV